MQTLQSFLARALLRLAIAAAPAWPPHGVNTKRSTS